LLLAAIAGRRCRDGMACASGRGEAQQRPVAALGLARRQFMRRRFESSVSGATDLVDDHPEEVAADPLTVVA
jgi:hypothetical protein